MLKVLIVDDSPEDRAIYKRHINKKFNSSCDLIECENGQEGIDSCKRENPDCILLDYSLPDMDGLEFLSLINERGYSGAVIMLTGQGSEAVAVEAMKGGADDYLVKNNFSSASLFKAITKSVNHNKMDETKKWKTQALVDPLTQVLNRNAYNLTMEQTIRDIQRYKDPTAFLVVDIDHFKRLNDSFGHKTGDEVLRLVAVAINNCVRSSDYIFRYGGEEFVVLLKKISMEQAERVAEKIRREVEENFHSHKGQKLEPDPEFGSDRIS